MGPRRGTRWGLYDRGMNAFAAGQDGAAGLAGVRVGLGWDRHRLEPPTPGGRGRPLVVGGVRFEHAVGPVARSDGDVLYHAVTDALLGALGLPDIGQLFPDTDAANEARDSSVFVAEAVRRVHAAGWGVVNLDTVVALQRPKLGAQREAIRANLARLLGVPADAVNVKGKTGEHVDAVGEGRAIEAQAVVLLARRAGGEVLHERGR